MDNLQDASWTQKAGITPGRIVLIGVLAVILVTVVVVQTGVFSSGNKPAPASKDRKPRVAVAAPSADKSGPSNSENAGDKTAAVSKRREWPTVDLEQIVRYDPFAVPPILAPVLAPPPPASNQSPDPAISMEDRLNELQKQGVDLVLVTSEGRVAVIGDRQLRVGDEINGYLITEITATGIVVKPNEKPMSTPQ